MLKPTFTPELLDRCSTELGPRLSELLNEFDDGEHGAALLTMAGFGLFFLKKMYGRELVERCIDILTEKLEDVKVLTDDELKEMLQ